MANNEVSVEITVEEKAALRALAKLTRGIDKTEKEAVQSFKKVDIAIGVFAANIATKAVTALADFAKEGVRAAATEMVGFDKAVREINTILPRGQKLTDDLKESLIGLSSQFGTTQAEQAKSYYQIISAGAAEGADAIKLLEQANKLAIGGLADVGNSINVLTDILNIYGQENITAEQAADSLFTTVRLGKTNISELASTMGTVLPSAQRLGVSLDEVGAALATMTTQGLTTSERVTQLQSLFTALFRKGGTAGKEFGKEIGDAFSLAALRTKGLSQFLEDLQTATGGNEETLVKLLGRVEAVQAVFSLTGKNAETLNSNLEEMGKKAGAASEAFNEVNLSLDNQAALAYQNTINAITKSLTGVGEAARQALIWYNQLFEEKSEDEQLKDLQKDLEIVEARMKSMGRFARKNDRERAEALRNEIRGLELLQMQREEMRKFSGGGGLSESIDDAPTSGGGSASTKLSPEQQAAIEREKILQAELRMIREQARLEEEQQQLMLKEQAGLSTEEDLERLREIEQNKLAVKAEFELEKTELIKSEKQKQLEQDKIFAKQELDLEKLTTKQKITELKRRQEQEKQIRELQLGTARNFLQAGITLAKDGSKEQKALLTADALISTYAAATKALAAPPGPPWSFALAASTVALGLANVAKINSFATGGVVGGFNGASLGQDNQMANVRVGEMILNASQQKRLFEIANTGQSGNNEDMQMLREEINSQPIVVQIDGIEVARAVRNARESGLAV